MTATRPAPAPLIGNRIRLDPLTEDDYPELWAAIGSAEVFESGFGGGPAGLSPDFPAFSRWAPGYFDASRGNIPHVVRVVGGPDDGAVIGTSTLGDFDERAEHAHIGWTAYSPQVWGTVVNPEAKLLLLSRAFDHGFGRVKIQTDVVNAQSRAAIEKLGAVYEGIVRRDRLRADGTWRDTVVYSVLVDEWPGVRAALEARVAAWGDRPVTLAAATR